ncbi:MAG TPA: hypothetical protein VIE65_20525 [Methylobacter sp.]|jgi:hypothetical protein
MQQIEEFNLPENNLDEITKEPEEQHIKTILSGIQKLDEAKLVEILASSNIINTDNHVDLRINLIERPDLGKAITIQGNCGAALLISGFVG